MKPVMMKTTGEGVDPQHALETVQSAFGHAVPGV
jgi:hypothetical protein